MSDQKEEGRQGVVIAAPKSGSGKTLITCALIQALCDRSRSVCSCKCGPDYIDPMFHRSVLGISGGNLDAFFTGEEGTRRLFLENTPQDSFVVVEGVMGLYDGIGGIREEGSTYHMARTLRLPVILVVDAHGMGRSILPLLAGFLSYDTAHRIRGVILNRVSTSYYPVLAKLIRQELSIEVLGYFPQQINLEWKSRHLGLMLPREVKELREHLKKVSVELDKTVQIDRILAMGKEAGTSVSVFGKAVPDRLREKPRPILAVARDEAFCFYYQENFTALRSAGFEIVEFSPIHDKKLPEGTSAILLGGGYPELFAQELSENEEMRHAVKTAVERGMPSVAECGGFLYLHQFLCTENGKTYPMVQILEGSCRYKGRSERFGYVELKEHISTFLPEGEVIRGHEFHYYDSTDHGNSCVAEKPAGTGTWECVWESDTHWWGFPHLYYPSNPAFTEHFYRAAIRFLNDEKSCGIIK